MALRSIFLVSLASSALASPKPVVQDVSAEPIETRDDGSTTFSVTQVKNLNFTGRTGLEAMLHAYAKFNATLTPELKKAMVVNPGMHAVAKNKRRTGTMWGSTSATPPQGYNYEYVSPVRIGTPPQTMYLDFDSGSADLWVFSTDTPFYDVNGQTVYAPGRSSTAARKPGYTWHIGYGDGSNAAGIVYSDRITIGNVVVPQMTVESATTVSSAFTSDVYNWGLMGLGMSMGNTVRPVQAKTFMDTIKSSLAAPVFTANLKHGVAGSYNFGYIDTTSYKGILQWSYVDKTSPYWKFVATGYRIGAGTAKYVTMSWAAIADTGTTLLLLPDDIVAAYYRQMAGAAYDASWAAILFPCADTPPDFAFGIGNYRGMLPGSYVNYGNVNATHCYGGIQSQGTLGFSIFGDIILKAQFVVFDLGNMRVGFANKVLTT